MSFFIPGVSGVRVPPIVTIASLSPLPSEKRWHALMPGEAYRWAEKKKRQRGWLIPVTYIGVVLIASSLALTWVPMCLVSALMASPSCFLPPLKDRVSRPLRVSCAHLAEMSLSKAHKLLRRENLSQGILWLVPFRGTPISTLQASSPFVRSGNSCLDLNMALLSP